MKAALLLWLAALPAMAGDLDSLFAPLADGHAPGLAVEVRQNGRTVWKHEYGARELRSFAPIDASTDFRLASVSKQFTAMSIMLLVRDGKLGYEQHLTDIFPEFPAYGKAITIRHLLTHTAGLPDYEDLMEGGAWTAEHQISDDEVLRLLEKQKAGKFAPGAEWAYSNSGYVVLGLIVAHVSRESYADFVAHHIFGPLEMSHTLAYVKGTNTVPKRAYGYTKQDGKFSETDQSATSATLGDGGIYSNLDDLAKWDDALEKHTLLSAADMRPALEAVKLNDGREARWPAGAGDDNLHPGQPVWYGFGWFLDPLGTHARMWHTGSTMGFRNAIERFPADRVTVIVLSNRADLSVEQLAVEAARRVLNANGS